MAPNVHWGGDGCRMHRFFAWPPLKRLGQALATQRVARRRGDCGIATTSGLPVGWLVDCRTDVVVRRQCAVTAAVIAGLLVVMGLGFVAARSLLSGGRRVGGFAGSIWRVALAGLQRRGRANAADGHFCYGDYVDAAPVGGAVLAHRSVAGAVACGCPKPLLLNLAPEEKPVLESFLVSRMWLLRLCTP